MKPRTVDIISMGCSKNLVDSERLIKMFEQAGITVKHNPECLTGDAVIVNTCGFIGDAKQESIEMILQCCNAKAATATNVQRVYVMGCLSQRFAEELPDSIPEVDGWYGKFDWGEIIRDLCGSEAKLHPWERKLTTPPHFAYVKIAEGCNRHCAFCAIPLITGAYKSRPKEEILEEVRDLASQGVKEFNVIAQDLTYYGLDLYGKQEIAKLVDQMAQIPGVKWIRLHYAYPTQFPYDLLPVMARHDNVCKYLDIALQHINDKVLANMRRHITADETRQLLKRIRQEVPGIHIRTTLMVGFPGEGAAEFQELLDFVKEQKFERMGAFAYCEEEDTYAARKLRDDVPEKVKEHRLDKLMALQEEIAFASNEAKVGTFQEIVIDSETPEYYIGRTQYDSPEVDPEVLIKKEKGSPTMEVGQFYKVEITGAMPFELIAKYNKE